MLHYSYVFVKMVLHHNFITHIKKKTQIEHGANCLSVWIKVSAYHVCSVMFRTSNFIHSLNVLCGVLPKYSEWFCVGSYYLKFWLSYCVYITDTHKLKWVFFPRNQSTTHM